MDEPTLKIADVTKPFEVETDAFDFSSGDILLQDGHPIVYENQLNDA